MVFTCGGDNILDIWVKWNVFLKLILLIFAFFSAYWKILSTYLAHISFPPNSVALEFHTEFLYLIMTPVTIYFHFIP